jgi:hypothetical protein
MFSDYEILTPHEVAQLMPASVPISWVYANWDSLGGVKIGKRKLILKEVLYANLQKRQVVVRSNREERKKLDAKKSGNGSDTVEKKRGCEKWRGRASQNSDKLINHSNEFGLIDAIQRVPERRKD